jgi:hypothetical protein
MEEFDKLCAELRAKHRGDFSCLLPLDKDESKFTELGQELWACHNPRPVLPSIDTVREAPDVGRELPAHPMTITKSSSTQTESPYSVPAPS